MDLADAALGAPGRAGGITRIFTLDPRDFTVYRLVRIGRVTIVPRPAVASRASVASEHRQPRRDAT